MNMFGSFTRSVSLLAASTLVSGALLAAAKTGKAEFTKVVGSASVDSVPAKVGTVAHPGSTVMTEAASKAYLYLGINGPSVIVKESSSLALDDLTYDDGGAEKVAHTKLTLKSGGMDADVIKKSSESTYVVTTPTATAAVRGTRFSVTPKGQIVVWKGCVDVTFNGKDFNVCKGQYFDPTIGGVADFTNGQFEEPDFVGFDTDFDDLLPSGPEVFVSPKKTGSAPVIPQGGE
ncbi:MAG TPA: FecR domain-containing protein [Candidatus Limnocylindria bacterium]|nr:FecR domain-containing protein [Candidatus Limnocylindria bacterium]